ncbi:MAG: S8 family serine peptidase [Deltaproteobacteria bacterium]|nr:S8 family serine peptidase [Deltaproteobacteria bacterium]
MGPTASGAPAPDIAAPPTASPPRCTARAASYGTSAASPVAAAAVALVMSRFPRDDRLRGRRVAEGSRRHRPLAAPSAP